MEEIKDCQAELLLNRRYMKEYSSLIYTCKNDMEVNVDVDNLNPDKIALLDEKVLLSFRKQVCFNCPYRQ